MWIQQLDGGDFSSELNELDDCYEGSKHYWKSGYLGQGYHAFIDAKKGCRWKFIGWKEENSYWCYFRGTEDSNLRTLQVFSSMGLEILTSFLIFNLSCTCTIINHDDMTQLIVSSLFS